MLHKTASTQNNVIKSKYFFFSNFEKKTKEEKNLKTIETEGKEWRKSGAEYKKTNKIMNSEDNDDMILNDLPDSASHVLSLLRFAVQCLSAALSQPSKKIRRGLGGQQNL